MTANKPSQRKVSTLLEENSSIQGIYLEPKPK